MSGIARVFAGTSLRARALRGAGISVLGFGGQQALRLASNLILTRLLFPEAFGMMALIAVILTGLQMFSDVGVTPSIMQSSRGDEPDFLNTAWTIQVIRGGLLWLAACALAWPFAALYDAPELTQFLPVAALALLVQGFNPTRKDSAGRHLLLGRLTTLELAAQVIGLIAAIGLAWALQSVWALVISGLVAAVAQLLLFSRYLPGQPNRFRWERRAATELIGFGKWIFLSTVAGFLFNQGDKLLLGKYLALGIFGIYNIGYFLASFPLILGRMVTQRILIPIYREKPPAASRENFLKLRKMRALVTLGLLAMLGTFAASGVWLVELLYDDRYALAGPVVVLLAAGQVPMLVGLTYDQAALAAGDSRRFFVLAAARAVLMLGALLAGLELAGLMGALIGQGVGYALIYPVIVWLARRVGAWDPLHDAVFLALGLALAALAVWWNFDAVAMLAVSGIAP
ncbi:MAG: oligosaccharide flippase family protein [Paracoccaceae bacterium]